MESKERLIELGRQVADWQLARGLSISEVVRCYPQLGSSKTYGLITRGEVDGLNVEKWLVDYGHALPLIQDDDRRAAAVAVIPDLLHMDQVKEAALGVAEETGINRFVLILGEPGTGKTTAMQHLAQTWGAKLVMMEATEPMRNSLQAFLAGLWMAVGVVVERKSAPPPANANACLVGLMDQLREVRKIIAIDEGHHLGPAALNTIKSLINSTGVAFMVAAKPDLFARLQCAAYSECSQLTRNRLHARVRLDNPPPKDLAQMITQSLHLAEDEDATEFAALLTEGCRRFGAWNWAALVCRRCRALTRGKGEVTKAIFKDAIARCESTR